MSLLVFKLGGSLLACESLRERMRGLLRQRLTDKVLIVVGGGPAADVVRNWSRLHCLSEETAHWVALRSLSLTRCLVQRLLPECEEVTCIDEASRRWTDYGTPLLLDVEGFLSQVELFDQTPLPHTWDVTSDSIAACVASRWSADELILVKSTGLEPDVDLELAVGRGLVDAHFHRIAAELPRVGWCNLLDATLRVQDWLEFGRCIHPPSG